MNLASLKEKINRNPKLKERVLHAVMHPTLARPRRWVRLFRFLYIKKGKGAHIYRSVRKDIVPFNRFGIGKYAVIEDFSAVNNAVGDVSVGDYARIGLSNVLIGPLSIGKYVVTGQHCLLVGLDHLYEDISRPLLDQGISAAPIVIGDYTFVGANSVVLSGVTIGQHCVVGAGSVVTRSVPDYSVCAGNPARIIKRYDFEKQAWVRVK